MLTARKYTICTTQVCPCMPYAILSTPCAVGWGAAECKAHLRGPADSVQHTFNAVHSMQVIGGLGPLGGAEGGGVSRHFRPHTIPTTELCLHAMFLQPT